MGRQEKGKEQAERKSGRKLGDLLRKKRDMQLRNRQDGQWANSLESNTGKSSMEFKQSGGDCVKGWDLNTEENGCVNEQMTM